MFVTESSRFLPTNDTEAIMAILVALVPWATDIDFTYNGFGGTPLAGGRDA